MLKQKPTPLIILGMHRSGTSCLAGTLEQTGLFLGKVSCQNKYNKKGNRENKRVMNLNDKILNYNSSSWDNPPKDISWNKEHEKEGQSIIIDLENNSKEQYWGFKDPRTLLTLAFWDTLLPKAKYIGTYRNPLSVAESLNRRKGSSIEAEAGLLLWLIYNKKMISFLQKKPFPLLSFDLSAEEYLEKINKLHTYFKFNTPYATNFFDKNLVSHTHKHNNSSSSLSKNILELYNILQKKQF